MSFFAKGQHFFGLGILPMVASDFGQGVGQIIYQHKCNSPTVVLI